jgi:hypothetical protein
MMAAGLNLRKSALTGLLAALACVLFASCGLISGDSKIGEGIVMAPKLKIRSSTAPVALDLTEVKRGDRLDIIDHAEVKTPTQVDEWYKVKTKAKDAVTGWVRARDLINQSIIEKSDDLLQKSKDTPSQGQGRLKVQTKLRVEPGGEVATFLNRGSKVDIVAKARTTIKPEKQQASEDTDEPLEEPEARTVLWYEVRLPDTELLRAGWVGAQQVELDVPEEIMYLEGEGRRFTGWLVLDQTKDKKGNLKNNYIGLMKSLGTEGPIDFTRIWVISYSPDEGHYTGPYIEDGLHGVLPVTLGLPGARKGFTIHEVGEDGKPVAVEYEAVRIDSSHLRVKRITPKFYYSKTAKKPRSRKK